MLRVERVDVQMGEVARSILLNIKQEGVSLCEDLNGGSKTWSWSELWHHRLSMPEQFFFKHDPMDRYSTKKKVLEEDKQPQHIVHDSRMTDLAMSSVLQQGGRSTTLRALRERPCWPSAEAGEVYPRHPAWSRKHGDDRGCGASS